LLEDVDRFLLHVHVHHVLRELSHDEEICQAPDRPEVDLELTEDTRDIFLLRLGRAARNTVKAI
jgi:hypothetical protein